MTITFCNLIAITWYLLTTEATGDESDLDLVKDFTALLIIIDIDTIIQPKISISFDELEVSRIETLEKRFLRYKKYVQKS